MLTTNDEVREAFRICGRTALHFAFALAFTEACGGFQEGCILGMFGMLENCLLSEDILHELMTKPHHSKASRITAKGVGVLRAGVHLFIGGLWHDTQDLGKVVPWVKNTFGPLIRVAVDAYRSFRSPKKARQASSGDKSKYHPPADLRVIRRMYAMQLARKPFKVSKGVQDLYFEKATPPATPPSPPSSPFASPAFTAEGTEIHSTYLGSSESSIHDGASLAGIKLANLFISPQPEEQPSTGTALQEPISLKRKITDDEDPLIPAARLPPRSPLVSRNLQAVSLPSSPRSTSLPAQIASRSA
ncbi:hypothetical protein MSAN_02463500 [Mycena sanguinolenta]|uniref:Uncharacterized protein n=1 Tax=Mycena sanguinolenta TaxID=230812 RepID=A0A8H6WX60_9AGAR|nr:hypothetical protein MSAN_02463500 [Mycena sanguinolenta]